MMDMLRMPKQMTPCSAMSICIFIVLLLPLNAWSGLKVYKDIKGEFSFKYPSTWEEVEPQVESTRVMLYARDGSVGTLNVSAIFADNDEVKQYNMPYFKEMLTKYFTNVTIVRVWTKRLLGQEMAFVEYRYLLEIGDNKIRARCLSMVTLRNFTRYMVVCNAPESKFNKVRPTFDIVVATFFLNDVLPEVTTYSDPERGYSINYPAQWIQSSTPVLPDTLELQMPRNQPGLGMVQVTQADKVDITDYTEGYFLMQLAQLDRLTIYKVWQDTVGTQPAAFACYDYFSRKTDTPMKIRCYVMIMLHNGKRYRIICGGESNKPLRAKRAFELMIHSFRFID